MVGNDMICPHCVKWRRKNGHWNNLRIHIDSVHSDCGLDKTFQCHECKKSFIFKYSLSVHVPKTHIKRKTHVCEICGHESRDSTALKEHVAVKHKSEEATKLFCDKCDFSTITRKNLLKHIRRKHNSESLEKCQNCEFETPDINNLQIHIDRYHQDIGDEKKYICDICSTAFIYESSLKYHRYHKCSKFVGDVSHPRSFKKRKKSI